MEVGSRRRENDEQVQGRAAKIFYQIAQNANHLLGDRYTFHYLHSGRNLTAPLDNSHENLANSGLD